MHRVSRPLCTLLRYDSRHGLTFVFLCHVSALHLMVQVDLLGCRYVLALLGKGRADVSRSRERKCQVCRKSGLVDARQLFLWRERKAFYKDLIRILLTVSQIGLGRLHKSFRHSIVLIGDRHASNDTFAWANICFSLSRCCSPFGVPSHRYGPCVDSIVLGHRFL